MINAGVIDGGLRMSGAVIRVRYINYRGEMTERTISPRSLRFAATEWHPEKQWILDAWDYGKGAERSFALKDMEWLR